MMATYHISVYALGDYPKLPITEAEFESLLEAKRVLDFALSVEEKYYLLCENFLELEKESLSLIAEFAVRHPEEYSEFFDIRLAFNRRVVNLVTATKLYFDQIAKQLSRAFNGSKELQQEFGQWTNVEYDRNFYFRFMEALRNYVQHHGLAVHHNSMKVERVAAEPETLLEFSMLFQTDRARLKDDGDFKKRVLDEMPEKVELRLAARSYLSSINSIHLKLRRELEGRVVASRELVESYLQKYLSLYPRGAVGIFALKYLGTEISPPDKKVLLTLNWDDVRIQLAKKSQSIARLEHGYVTGRASEKIVKKTF